MFQLGQQSLKDDETLAALRPMYQQFEEKLLIEAGVLTAEAPKVSVSAEEFAKFQAWMAKQTNVAKSEAGT